MAYATQANLTAKWGSSNILKWSDLDGTNVLDANRCAAALAWADAEINSRLTGGQYAVPLQAMDPYTTLIVQDWSATLAGWWLYTSRGLLDKDEQGDKLTSQKKAVEDGLNAARSGARRLAATRRWAPNPTGPGAF